jgi:predicted TIM-barrel fold metal-dependent hydrolase
VIDCDVHCVPESWDVIEPHLSAGWRNHLESGRVPLTRMPDAYPASRATSATMEVRAAGGPLTPTSYEALRDRLLEPSGASHAILNCLTIFDSQHNPYYQAALARALNDWLRTDWLDRDERLRASIIVPWTDPEAAVAEIERLGDDPHFVQVLLPVRALRPWGQKAHHGMFAAAAERGLPIAINAWGLYGHAPTPSGMTTTYVEDYLSNQSIVQEQVASFVAEGVFDRFPALRLVLMECGFNWLPALLWRMDKHWRSLWPEIPWVKEQPSHYVRQHLRMTTSPAHLGDASDEQIRELVGMIGVETLLYASDHPHDHGPSGERLLDALDEPSRNLVLAGNAATLYRL